jgi:hypothetical protein
MDCQIINYCWYFEFISELNKCVDVNLIFQFLVLPDVKHKQFHEYQSVINSELRLQSGDVRIKYFIQ